MIDIKAMKPAKRYAEALFEVVKNKDCKKNLSDINEFLNLYETNEEFKNLLLHPVISKEDKKDVIRQIFASAENEIMDFIFILLDENRIDCLDEVKDFLTEKLDEENRITKAQVTLAVNPDNEMKAAIKSKLEEKLKSSVECNFFLDEEIIGGMLIRIKDTVLDLSVKKKMEKFKQI